MDTRMAQDYYEVLGIARDADGAAIKRAYRQKARELHPDVSEDPDAETKFRSVTEAYEVLSDDGRRATYDRFGHEGLKRGGFESQFTNFGSIADIFGALFGDGDPFGGARGRAGQSAGASRGEDVQIAVQLSFRDAVLGVEREVSYTTTGTCGTCDGVGATSPEGVEGCETCGGAGAVRQVARSIFGQVVQERTCPRCGGRGKVVTDPCGSCHGTGEQPEERIVTVAIPAGIQDGQRIRLTGRGGVGSSGGPDGNLYVDIRAGSDERFLREGDDLVTVLDLSMTQAALGGTTTVPTVDGEPHTLEVPAGTQPGTRLVVRGLGAGRLRGIAGHDARGDLVVFCNVMVPRDLTAEQRAALGRFGDIEGERNYRAGQEGEGIFQKLKRMVRP